MRLPEASAPLFRHCHVHIVYDLILPAFQGRFMIYTARLPMCVGMYEVSCRGNNNQAGAGGREDGHGRGGGGECVTVCHACAGANERTGRVAAAGGALPGELRLQGYVKDAGS